MKKLLEYWNSHGTKILGFVSGSIAAVAGVGGLIPEAHLKYYMAAIALMTFWRGFTNSAQQDKSE
jgi:hypothetical protein